MIIVAGDSVGSQVEEIICLSFLCFLASTFCVPERDFDPLSLHLCKIMDRFSWIIQCYETINLCAGSILFYPNIFAKSISAF